MFVRPAFEDSWGGTLSTFVGFRSATLQNASTGSPTLNNYVGFDCTSVTVASGNTQAFRGQIASGTNRWNCYMQGTADNYFEGDSGFGTNAPSEKVHSSAKVRADTVFNVNGTDGVSGSFTTADAKTVTVTGGIITAIV